MIPYDLLLIYLKNQKKYKIAIRKNYSVITVPGSSYHITIFRDQWDYYESVTGLPYHMFHISIDREDNKCSTYFWVDKTTDHIEPIPEEHFKYEQPDYGFYSSTRKPCRDYKIEALLKTFQRILNAIVKIEKMVREKVGKKFQLEEF